MSPSGLFERTTCLESRCNVQYLRLELYDRRMSDEYVLQINHDVLRWERVPSAFWSSNNSPQSGLELTGGSEPEYRASQMAGKDLH